jgi:hypothetical protein
MEPADPNAVEVLFVSRDPVVREIYARLMAALGEIGPCREDPKKRSIHLLRDVGFAGVHPRKHSLLLNIRTDRPIESPRVAKSEQISRNRFHNEVKLFAPDDVDDELIGWLRDAYALG